MNRNLMCFFLYKSAPVTYKEVGRFLVNTDHQLGRGGVGEVFLGHDPVSMQNVAAKKVWMGDDKDWIAIVEREVETLDKIPPHPNIVSFIDSVFENAPNGASLWLFTEYCELGDMDKYCQRFLLSIAIKFDFIAQLCQAIHHIHHLSPPVVHRDIKPGNILVMIKDGRVIAKLCDFGLSKITVMDNCKTVPMNTPCGTPNYMAPELFRIGSDGNIIYNRSVDIFAAAVFFTALLEAEDYQQLKPMKGGNGASFTSVV